VDVDMIEAGRDSARLQEFPVGPGLMAPCPLWSPDGQWLAFALSPAQSADSTDSIPPAAVRFLFVSSGGYSDVKGPAIDIDWSPDSSTLAVASDGEIRLVSTDRAPRSIAGTDRAHAVSWSPDGRFIAFQRASVGQDASDLVVIDPVSGVTRILVIDYPNNHGIGPVWSPDGHKLVYQRLCSTQPERPGIPCREQHDVVVLSATNDDWLAAPITETVMPESRESSSGTEYMWPFYVTWSPDSADLLYTTFDMSLIAVPIAPGSMPTVLVQRPDLSNSGGPGAQMIQSWQRTPGAP
jgi:Tol biopolymer transport system component